MAVQGVQRYKVKLAKPLSPGSKIIFTGKVSNNPKRIDLDLLEDEGGRFIILHFNPRFFERAVVRNSCTAPGWGSEERQGGFPFRPGSAFKVEILCQQSNFSLSVDDRFLAQYAYRMPLSKVKYIRVADDVESVVMKLAFGGVTDKCTSSGTGRLTATNTPQPSIAIIAVKSSEEISPSRPSGPLPYSAIQDYFLKGQVHTDQFRMKILKVTHVQMNLERKLSGSCMWLWHGTRSELLPSIFKTGLSPPERDTKGLLGDGIYFADRASKSAQYCFKGKKPPAEGYLLLCKVLMGTPYTASSADNNRKSAPTGYHSVECKGQFVPDPKGAKSADGAVIHLGSTVRNSGAVCDIGQGKKLQFNEYVVYSGNHISISYLVHFQFQ